MVTYTVEHQQDQKDMKNLKKIIKKKLIFLWYVKICRRPNKVCAHECNGFFLLFSSFEYNFLCFFVYVHYIGRRTL